MIAYDPLGRRIEKRNLITPSNTRRYYYNNSRQSCVNMTAPIHSNVE
ncbi:MAG: hypothetical protein ACYS4W_13560 [Planctomycetota bacterium]